MRFAKESNNKIRTVKKQELFSFLFKLLVLLLSIKLKKTPSMRILSIFLLVFCFCVENNLGAQTANGRDSSGNGRIVYNLAPGLENLVEKYKKANYSSQGPEGFRVQIFSEAGNPAKDRADNMLQEFSSAFSDTPVYLTYEQPNFKVRAGDFRTKAEARKLQKRINYQYPGAFIVKDKIKVN